MHRLNIGCDSNLQATTREVLQRTANNYSSTFQDVRNRRQTELPFINGMSVVLAISAMASTTLIITSVSLRLMDSRER
jgi:ketopantoate reductase